MKTTYVIPASELGKFERRLAQNLRLEQQRGLRAAGQRAVSLLRQVTQDVKDLGEYQNGWRATAKFNQVDVENVSGHAIFVEDGRAAGSRQPPIDAIMGWVMRRIGDPRAAFPIARAISRRGIAARRALSSAVVQAQISDVVVEEARAAWARAARASR